MQVGDRVPHQPDRIVGPACPPTWYALMVRSGRERVIAERLREYGVHVQYPVTKKWRVTRGQRKRVTRPTVSGVIYARFTAEPRWHVLKDRRWIVAVFGIGSAPAPLPYDVVRVAMGLAETQEEIERAAESMAQLRRGDQARFVDGPFAGHVVDITHTGPLVHFIARHAPHLSGTAPANKLEKIVDQKHA